MEKDKIIIKIIKKQTGSLIGYKLDTWWHLGDKRSAKTHYLTVENKIKSELISNLGGSLRKYLIELQKTNIIKEFNEFIEEYDQTLICYELENGETFPQILIEYNELNKQFIFQEYTRQDLIKEKLIQILK